MLEGSHAPKPEPGRVLEPKLSRIGSLNELTGAGFTAFALGPVYVYGGVQDDLVAAFAAERAPGRPQDVHATVVRFDRPVLAACKEWSCILSIMDSENFEWFKDWMTRLQLVDRQRQTFWLVRYLFAPVMDPILLDSTGGRQHTSIPVFSLSGMLGRIVPHHGVSHYDAAPEYIRFSVLPPDPEVVKLGSIALEVISGS
jgi:hypothetical protein